MTLHVYENKGVMDIRAITVMGMNAKKNDGSIGYFGTGFKFALATLARNNCEVTIHLGDGNSYKLSKHKTMFRDAEFYQLSLGSMNNEEVIDLPFTDQLGKDWQLWQAMREIESNCRDEAGTYKTYEHGKQLKGDNVTVIISGDAYDQCVEDHHSTLFFDTAVEGLVDALAFRSDELDIVFTPAKYIYVNGVRASSGGEYPISLNIKRAGLLSEDRMLGWGFVPSGYLSRVAESFTQEMWQWFADWMPEGDFQPMGFVQREIVKEGDLSYQHAPQSYYRAVERHYNAKAGAVSHSIAHLYNLILNKRRKEYSDEDNVDGGDALIEACEFLSGFGYAVKPQEVTVVKTLGANIHGLCEGMTKKIFLSQHAFNKGQLYLNAVLFEEVLHRDYEFEDHTREFQSFLVHELVNMQQNVLNLEDDLATHKIKQSRTKLGGALVVQKTTVDADPTTNENGNPHDDPQF